MAQYYYLLASLPYLSYEGDMYLDREIFYSLCREQLSAADLSMLTKTHLAQFPQEKGLNDLLLKWYWWEKSLRNELVKLRAQAKAVEAEKYLVESQEVLGLAELAREAFQQASPLEAEQLLDRARWRYFEELGIGHYFDLPSVLLYSLKLELLERKRKLNLAAGRKRFEELYDVITEDIRK